MVTNEGRAVGRVRRHWLIIAVIGILASVLFSMRGLWFVPQPGFEDPVAVGSEPYRADGKLRVLILGEDEGLVAPGVTGARRSDTLMVASFDPEDGSLSLLSIPRDTLVEIPGRKGKDKINHALAFGGTELAVRTVSQFLGIPLRYYVQVRTDAFKRLVDAVDGVPIYVEKDMRYTDEAGGLYINLKQGEQVLNGTQAEGYVRWRLDSDLKRIERQQKFIAAAVKQVLKPKNILKLNQLLKIAFDSFKTNVPFSVGLRYLSIVDTVKEGNVTAHTIAGDDEVWINGINYFQADEEALATLIQDYFYSSVDKEANASVSVQVLVGNGDTACGVQLAELLRSNGFNVLSICAADRDDYSVSQVVGRDEDMALAVAQALNLHEVLVEPQIEGEAAVVVTVGRDFLP